MDGLWIQWSLQPYNTDGIVIHASTRPIYPCNSMTFKNVILPLDLEYFSAAMLGPDELKQAIESDLVPWTGASRAKAITLWRGHKDQSELVGFKFSRAISQPDRGIRFNLHAVYGEFESGINFVLPSPKQADAAFPGWNIASVTDWYPEASEQYLGICKECGGEAAQCEPDAEDYECLDCGASAVQGCDNVIIHFA